ncbi:NAD(P)/FAD-dependent oxidoreductase [Kyrpidia sp.]|uniref:NAD(P)/FAD-dependent oxidoreductase n=1 Tax=Kyrpidia sp. TaxID=2073077 RepID=UPI0025907FF3|nr:NAD(P)/FAD-dependent oxidoreductase [Kyrpidia sp.]MCL6576145.1 NAD(P)/FAD-dependent oxidoreductase [Kyrpidia sp.]
MPKYDVVIIGGGVVGTSIFRRLSSNDISVALLERAPDVCEGASKANSGIVHTGFDAKPNTLEAKLLQESRELWPDLIESLHIPYLPCGAIMVATDDQQFETLSAKIIPTARENGVEPVLQTADEVKQRVPCVNPDILGGLFIEGESLVDPFWATRAFAELGVANGGDVYLEAEVVGIDQHPDHLTVRCAGGLVLEAGWLVNAAGLWADEVARMVGDESFTLTPRKGQFVLTEDELGLTSIILPVPTEKSKGILVTPVVFGGTLLGPTAEDQIDKRDRSTTEEGLLRVIAESAKLVPAAAKVSSIRQFAGVRAVCSAGDYVIRPSSVCPRLIHAAGIRSTGVSASPGIAAEVERVLKDLGALSGTKAVVQTRLPDRFTDEANNGEVVCLCRSITRHEIELVLNVPPVPSTLDGIKRRTGAMLGECQGNLCAAAIMDMISKARNIPVEHVCKHAAGSHVIVGIAGSTAPVEQRAQEGGGTEHV